MNKKQAERKREKAQLHSRAQYEKKMATVREVLDKLRSDKKKANKKLVTEAMQKRGYVPDGRRGKWRPINKVKHDDKITKEM